MKVYLIVLLLIVPSLGRPGVPTNESVQDGDKEPASREPAATVPLVKDDLRIHQEIAETILKSRTDPKNQGQNVVISASVSVNTDQNATNDSVPAKYTSSMLQDDHPTEIVNRGIAVPLTMEEIEKEMEMANKKQPDSSTQKEGISTWILLNGSGPTVQPDLKPSQYRAEIDKKVDKIARIKEGQINKQTVDISNAINKRNEAKLKQRPKTPSTTTTTTTTTTAPDELLPVYDEDEDYDDEDAGEMIVEPVVTVKPPTKPPTTKAATTKTPTTKAPVSKKPQNNNKQSPKTTTTTTEVAPTEAPQKPETTTFLIMEPKDAGFDMPQDRSPNGNVAKKKKRPNVNNKNNNADKKKKKNDNKKKPAVDSDIEVKNSTKAVNVKQPQKNVIKPISTQIYNYLAREVMPTVGVGLVGLVVAGGLASYLLGGPFGALRRSYDIQDRKDDLYHFNNEEYAGQSDGQNEEDMFGKVIAGMPSSSLYRNNIRYQSGSYRPNPNQIYQQPGPQMHPAYSKYGPYNSRYRYNPGYRPGAQSPSAGSPYPPQYQQTVPQQSYPPQPQYRYSSAASPNQQPSENIKTIYAQSQPSGGSAMGQVSPVYSADRSDSSAILEQTQSSGYSVGGTMDNQLQHRTQFVVGSAIPETPIATEFETQQTEEPETEGSTAIPVPEHGPRRRKRSTPTDDEERKISNKKINDNEIDNENDIDGGNSYYSYDVKETESVTKPSEAITTPDVVTSTEPVTSYPGQGTPFIDFFRRVLELKVRYGLSFLQNTTNAFQRYLSGVQERVNSSPIFNPQY